MRRSTARATGKWAGSEKAKKESWGRSGEVSGRRRQKLKGPRLTLPSRRRARPVGGVEGW